MSLLAVLALFISAVIAQGDKGGCDFADNIPDAQFQVLLQAMAKESLSNYKMIVLQNWAKNNTLGFSSNQTVTVLRQFPQSTDRVKAVQTVSAFILTLECQHINAILSSVNFAGDKMELLKLLVNLANKVDLKLNNQTLLSQWTLSNDIAAAKQIIARARPRSCLFGPANIPIFTFIIDVSGSMSDRFKDQDGQFISRLDYVKRDLLQVMNSTLESKQQFNIVIYSTYANSWQPGVVPASPSNIAGASAYVQKLGASGSTNTGTALRLAFSDPKVMGVYLLSDGDPSDSIPGTYEFARQLKKPINTICFKGGKSAANYMFQLANITRGTFRNIV